MYNNNIPNICCYYYNAILVSSIIFLHWHGSSRATSPSNDFKNLIFWNFFATINCNLKHLVIVIIRLCIFFLLVLYPVEFDSHIIFSSKCNLQWWRHLMDGSLSSCSLPHLVKARSHWTIFLARGFFANGCSTHVPEWIDYKHAKCCQEIDCAYTSESQSDLFSPYLEFFFKYL